MHPAMIRTIFFKDLRDAIRDARVLVAILVPLGIGIFYSVVFDDADDLTSQNATAAYFATDETRLPDALRDAVGDAVRIDFEEAQSAESVEEVVKTEDADIGFVVPPGFDTALAAGEQPGLDLYLPDNPTLGAQYIAQAFEPAVRTMAGQEFPVAVAISTVEEPIEAQSVLDRLGLRTYMVLFSIVFLIGMIAMLVVPVILAEEAEKKTLDALVLVASYPDVIAGKALVGVAYIGIALGILLAITRIEIEMLARFMAAALVAGVALIGIGLIMAGLFKSANQLNTWSGVLLLPVIAPAVLVGAPVNGTFDALLLALPTSQMMRLMTDATVGDAVFGGTWLSFVVIAGWGVAAYAVVAWQLSRRQA